MNKIYQVLSNLKFGDTLHRAGSIIEAEEAKYGYLVKDGVLRVIEGAESVEHAAELIGEEAAAKTAAAAEVKKPEDTWAPKPPAPTEPETVTPEAVAEQKAHDEATSQAGAPEAPKEPVAPAESIDAGLNL